MRYSALSLALNAFTGHRFWRPAWRDAAPKDAYDVVIVGGGGHGLATAFYLAKNHGVRRVAVVERGWLGNGSVGRNTTIIRSNYLHPANARFYEFALKLWESLEQTLNYNVMVSQRGILNVFHSDAQRDAYVRRGNAMRIAGVDAELLGADEVRNLYPIFDFDNARFPIRGGLLQPRGGTVRHDAVAWGYARAASDLGVDIIQNAEVVGIDTVNGKAVAVETTRGRIAADRIGLSVAGHTSHVAAMAGLVLPIESHVIQAFVTEAVKPLIPGVVTFGAGHFYVSQSDKGGLVFGGDLDGYGSYAGRGSLPTAEEVAASGMALMPAIGRLRILRNWGGVIDMTPDGSPFIDRTPVENLYLNGGWNYGGFKATPAAGWTFAHLLATGEPHELAADFRLDRYATGCLLDENGQGAQPNLH